MPYANNKVVVAMSGGVDSSVTAALLLEQGYDLQGVSLRMWEGNAGLRVCSDHRGAEKIAALLGIPHTLLDLRAEFMKNVVKPFARAYLGGRTPNPCVACNRDFKLGALVEWAKAWGAQYVATGHYARLARDAGRTTLFRGADCGKDQSYFLFALSQDQLAHTLFPLGALHKREVRQQARRFGLPVADRPESQDICFGDYRALVESYGDQNDVSGGEIVDSSGKALGRHAGIHTVTIGQRRGLGVSAPEALYVAEIDAKSKRVVLGNKEALRAGGLIARDVNWIDGPDEEEIGAEVQVRYRSTALPCAIRMMGDGSCEVRFNEAFSAVTPGQAAVFYRGDRLLGGGWIEKAIKV